MSDSSTVVKHRKKIDKVLAYLKQAESDTLSDRVSGEFFLKFVDKELLSEAKAEYRGEKSLSNKETTFLDPGAARTWWQGAVKKFNEDPWIKQAEVADKELKAKVPPFIKGVDDVARQFDELGKQPMDLVKQKAKSIAKELRGAKADLERLLKKVDSALASLKDYGELGALLANYDPPQDNVQREAYTVQIANATQKCRAADEELQRAVKEVNELCLAREERLRELMKQMIVAVIAWRKTEKFRKAAEAVESIANGIAYAANLNPEPISNTAMAGLHMLFKGICDGAKVVAAAIEASDLNVESLDDLVDQLMPNDFVNARLDAITLAISWAAEPLGFIPAFGGLLRAIINGVTGAVTGTLKTAAERYAAAVEESKKTGGKPVPKTLLEDLGKQGSDLGLETTRTTANSLFEGLGKGALQILAAIAGSKDLEVKCDIGEFATQVAFAVFGPAIQELVAHTIGSLDLVDKEAIKEKLKETRELLEKNSKQCEEIQALKLDFACDMEEVRRLNREAVKALTKDNPGPVTALVGISAALPETAGALLLIGDGHSPNTLKFFKVLEDAQVTHKGSVKYQENKILRDSLLFAGLPKDLVKDYVSAYGSGDKRITGKPLEFA